MFRQSGRAARQPLDSYWQQRQGSQTAYLRLSQFSSCSYLRADGWQPCRQQCGGSRHTQRCLQSVPWGSIQVGRHQQLQYFRGRHSPGDLGQVLLWHRYRQPRHSGYERDECRPCSRSWAGSLMGWGSHHACLLPLRTRQRLCRGL